MVAATGKIAGEPEAGRPNGEEEGPLTESQDIPALVVSRDELAFTAHGKCVRIPLHTLMNGGNAGAVGLLLYAVVLKLSDIDFSMRKLAEVAETQQGRIEHMTGGGAQGIVAAVVHHLGELGIFPPGALGAQVRSTGGDGKDPG